MGERVDRFSGGHIECEYNALGQQVRKRDRDGETRYFWNAQGLLARVQLPNGDEWTYRYDALARRVEKRGPKERTEFVWDGDVVLHEVHIKQEAAQPAIHWEFDPYGFAPIGKIEKGKHYLCVNNVNGTPEELRASDGDSLWVGSCTSSGQQRAGQITEVDCPISFLGQWKDHEVGLHYNRYRYYEPAAGRYISSDPIEFLGGSNSFLYSTNQIKWADPYGLSNTSCPNFATDEKLQEHFDKHGEEFGVKTKEEYLEMAQSVTQNGIKVQYTYKGEQRTGFLQIMGNRSRNGDTKFAFVGTNNNGKITTFHVESGNSFWKMLNGSSSDKSINPVQ